MARRFAFATLLLFVTAVITGCRRSQPAGPPVPPADAPNVLIITLDTTRADRIGCYGHAAATTPAIDGLAATGVRFDRAFCLVPLTFPSHVALLSGTYPPSNGIRINASGALAPDVPMLAEAFKKRGYRTAAFIAAWVLRSELGLARGFDHYDDNIGGGRDLSRSVVERPADQVIDAALRWLDDGVNAPFFAWVHLFDPHYPYDPPARFRESVSNPYDGEIAFADSQVRRLLDRLDRKGLRERTLIVVTGDHGEAFSEHDELGHGLFIYGATMHVPLIFNFPSHLPTARVVPGCVSLVDVVPTILDLMGWEPYEGLDGRSLAPACRTGELTVAPIYAESEYPHLGFGWSALRFFISGQWKYIEAPRPELYDLAADPRELNNVVLQESEVAEDLSGRLADLLARMSRRQAESVRLDADALDKLASLGYVGSSNPTESDSDAPLRDPKDMTEVFRGTMAAKEFSSQGRHAETVALLEPLVILSPESGSVHGALGYAYLRLGRFQDAEKAYEMSLRTHAHDPTYWCGFGDALRLLGRTDQSIPAYQKALEVGPNYGQPHMRLAMIYTSRGEFQRAYEHYRRYAELNPRSPDALVKLANIMLPLGHASESVELVKKALSYDPQDTLANQLYGRALRLAGRPREAIDALRAARKILPEDHIVIGELAWLLATAAPADLRNGTEALELSEAYARTNPNGMRSLDLLAAAYAELGNFTQAADLARRALTSTDPSANAGLQAEIEARLQLYESHRPFREGTRRTSR